jgi:hypothetical protein
MADEHDIAVGVMRIAASRSSGVCTFKRAYLEIPNLVPLSPANTAASVKRPGEQMWQQIVRNIKSHFNIIGNAIYDGHLSHVPRVGYKITAAGNSYLRANGFI